MTLKNINVLVLLFLLIINTIKGDGEACCEDCCNGCFKKESEDINAKENESNKVEEIYEEKSKENLNNLLQNNAFMENNNQDNNQNYNLYNNQNNFQNNFQLQNNLQNNAFQNNAPQNNRFITGETLGLENVGATCYMNATLQCLFHIKELSHYFFNWYCYFYKSNQLYLFDFLKKKPLFAQYMNLLCQVFYPEINGNQNTYYAPKAFKDIISELNPLFQGVQANDAKDLLQCIFENMHNELKYSIKHFQEYDIDQRDENAARQYFYDSFITQNQSPLFKFLYGLNKTETTCLKCQRRIYNFQSYNLLYFPLKEAKRVAVLNKKDKNPNFDEKNYVLTLEDCFAHAEQIEHYSGNNTFFCAACNKQTDADSQTVLYTTPTVLAIVLNRGKANLDFQEKFKFGLDLDIKKYIYSPDIKHGKYYLIGMVVHSGESGTGGHFIAYCRMDKNSKWFCYNDAWVNECDNIEEKFNVNKPYILFYHYDNDV